MTDTRTRREKLEAMANQSTSPSEAEAARMFLAAIDRRQRERGEDYDQAFDLVNEQFRKMGVAFAEGLRDALAGASASLKKLSDDLKAATREAADANRPIGPLGLNGRTE